MRDGVGVLLFIFPLLEPWIKKLRVPKGARKLEKYSAGVEQPGRSQAASGSYLERSFLRIGRSKRHASAKKHIVLIERIGTTREKHVFL